MREALEHAMGGPITIPDDVRLGAIFEDFYPCSSAESEDDLDEIALHIAEKHRWHLRHLYGLTFPGSDQE